MERIPGRQLFDVWPTMSEVERFGLVKGVVAVEKKLMTANLSKYGSIYYRDDCPTGLSLERSPALATSRAKDISRFVIGPVLQQPFWTDKEASLDISRGPCRCTSYYEPTLCPIDLTSERIREHCCRVHLRYCRVRDCLDQKLRTAQTTKHPIAIRDATNKSRSTHPAS